MADVAPPWRKVILDYLRRVVPVGLHPDTERAIQDHLVATCGAADLVADVCWANHDGERETGLLVVRGGIWSLIVMAPEEGKPAMDIRTTLLGKLEGVVITQVHRWWTEAPAFALQLYGLELEHKRFPGGGKLRVSVPQYNAGLAEGKPMTPDQHLLHVSVLYVTGHVAA